MDWMHWRGPSFDGSTTEKNLPTSFSRDKGVRWSAPMPGLSAATPIVAGNSVFTTAADDKAGQLLAICLDVKTGKERWSSSVGSGYRPGGEGTATKLDERGHYAQPSPTTDGKSVYFFFGNGDLAAFDVRSGRKLWARNLQKEWGDFAFQWTFSSSPLLHGGTLFVQVLQRNQRVGSRGISRPESFLVAVDTSTGKDLWRSVRPSDAVMESCESYASPIPLGATKKLLVAGGDVLTCHEGANGRESWRSPTWNASHREAWWRLVPSPVAGDGVALVCAPKRAPVYAIHLESGALVWKSEERSVVTSDVPTPAFWGGSFFVLSDVRKALSRVEAKTGKILWSVALSGKQMCWASPTVADGKIYLVDLGGSVFVLDAKSGKLLAENPMDADGAEVRSTLAIAQGNLFLRTSDRLYCLGG